MKAYVDRLDAWLMQAFADPEKPRKVKYCRILWRCISGRKRWYVQSICEGGSPVKHIYAPTGRKAAIDPSTKSVTVAFEDDTAEKIDISSELQKDRREVRLPHHTGGNFKLLQPHLLNLAVYAGSFVVFDRRVIPLREETLRFL